MMSVLLMMMKMAIDTVVEVKHSLQCLSCFCCVLLDLFTLFSVSVRKKTVLSVATSIQGRLPLLFLTSVCVVSIRKQLLCEQIWYY